MDRAKSFAGIVDIGKKSAGWSTKVKLGTTEVHLKSYSIAFVSCIFFPIDNYKCTCIMHGGKAFGQL